MIQSSYRDELSIISLIMNDNFLIYTIEARYFKYGKNYYDNFLANWKFLDRRWTSLALN